MPEARTTILFTTLAMYQTPYFAALDRALTERGYRVAHLCFHERSHEWLTAQGLQSHNAFALADKVDRDTIDPAAFGVEDLELLIGHEAVYFQIHDRDRLARDFKGYLGAVDGLLRRLTAEAERVVVVQELGGFLSLLGTFHAARARGLDNIFIEPAFFKGRLFFVRNSFAALAIAGPDAPGGVAPEVDDYIERTLAAGRIVIPNKDKAQYRPAAEKLGDRHNQRRLLEKLVDKYLLGKREVFSHIGFHVKRHIGMYLTSRRLAPHYRNIPEDSGGGGPFVYYPLHVPADFSLTIRSPDCLDQYALLERALAALPPGHKLAIKEHPALVGAVDYARTAALLKHDPRLVLLDPGLNNFEVMRRATAVLTVNSKSGAEALLLGRPVIVLGDAFYRPCALVRRAESLAELPALLAAACDPERPALDETAIRGYFQAVWDASRPGELYDIEPDNVATCCEALIAEIEAGA